MAATGLREERSREGDVAPKGVRGSVVVMGSSVVVVIKSDL
jgi:hypothetical protein